MITGEQIVALLFKRGGFSDESVRLTASAFFWHQTGLVFIASNRVIAPAFYARSDSKTPAWAGIASFVVNVAIVALVAHSFKGPGIAFALSFSSAVNTAILVAVLLRRRTPGMAPALAGGGLYALKLLAFSLAAALPVLLLKAPLSAAFSGSRSHLVAIGAPFLLLTLVYACVGVGLLVVTKDKVAGSLAASFRARRGK